MMKKISIYLTTILLTVFGLLTLFLSSSIILDLFDIREKEGNYVLFVVWANFISSLIYLGAAYGILKKQKWATKILCLSAIILIAAFIGLQFHIQAGGLYEQKTIGALIFRFVVTIALTLSAYFLVSRKKPNK